MGKVDLNPRLLKKESNHLVVISTNCKVQGTLRSVFCDNIRINPLDAPTGLRRPPDDLLKLQHAELFDQSLYRASLTPSIFPLELMSNRVFVSAMALEGQCSETDLEQQKGASAMIISNHLFRQP